MLTQTIFELSQEAERLLQLALQNLQTLKNIPHLMQDDKTISLLNDNDKNNLLRFSEPGLEMQQDMLHNELRKVTQHEMVLAIIGTMKAGKSTTINAIIGTEVLPNRNRPMTALPTLIRHTPGQREPVLHFPHVKPIETLMIALQQKLHQIDKDSLAGKLEIDRDMADLLERITCGTGFERRYLGAKPIFYCLKNLNDLVRLAGVLDVAFPFSAYAAIEHVPFIEVEFVHLAGLGKGLGQLTLLDTPGPNEAGQPYLQEMLNQQLAQASAVLAIMDYTQLKSVSDEEVRRAIQRVSKSVPLYILVNKFDQKDRNSDDESQIKAMVAGTLMKGSIEPDRVFPVSSMWGYLANRTRYELSTFGHLPDPQQQSWVQDFAEEALGRRWRLEDLADRQTIAQAANLLWEDSLLGRPIKSILHVAHANASLYALRSASHKLLDYAQSMESYLQFRRQGLQVTNHSLQTHIVQLGQDIPLLQKMGQRLEQEARETVSAALTESHRLIQAFEQRIYTELENYFHEGILPHEKKRLSHQYNSYITDFPVASDRIELEDENTAHTILHKIRAAGELILFAAQETLTGSLASMLRNVDLTLTNSIHDALDPLDKRVSHGLAKPGLSTEIKFSALQLSQFNFDARHIFADGIEHQQIAAEQPMRSVRVTVARWLNSADWGRDYHARLESRYVIDLVKLKNKFYEYIHAHMDSLWQMVKNGIDASMSGLMEMLIDDFSQAIDGLRANLEQSLAVKQQNEVTQKALDAQLKQCIRSVGYLREDSQLLRQDLQTLSVAEQ